MDLLYLLYWSFAVFLAAVYAISIAYLLAFRMGYSMKGKPKREQNTSEKLSVSVIVPIYNEDTNMIRETLDTLLNQKGIKINLIAVMKHARQGQVRMIKGYAKTLNSVEVIMQRGKPSHNEAFIIGLKRVKTEYTSILCSDAKIKGNYLVRMVAALHRTGKDAAFGLLYPEIKDTRASKFTAIDKVFRQTLTLKGRAALDLGCYIPGAFAVYRTNFLNKELKPLMRNNFVMHDVGFMLKLYAGKENKMCFIPDVVGTELEKSSLTAWTLQYMRWMMGMAGLLPALKEIFSKARNKIKVGTFGLMMIWKVLPITLFLGLLLSIAGAFFYGPLFLEFYIIVYAILTFILFTISDVRAYGLLYCVLFWGVSQTVKAIATLASLYGFAFAKYRENKLYMLFKR